MVNFLLSYRGSKLEGTELRCKMKTETLSFISGVNIVQNLILKDRQRSHGVEDNVMELLDIKTVPETGLGQVPQLDDLELAHLVGHGLSGPGDVPPHLRLDPLLTGGRVVEHVLDGLLRGPVQGVEPSVHHQPAGPEYLLTEVTEPGQC